MGRKSKATIRKKEILSHFYEVLTEQGFEGTSIAKIAKRMKVNPSLLIHYFSTKEEMIMELVDTILVTYQDGIFPKLKVIEDPKERFEELLNYSFGTDWNGVIADSVFFDCFALSLRNEEIEKRFKAMYDSLRSAIKEEIEYAISEKVISISSTDKAVDLLFVLMEGAHMYNRLNEKDNVNWKRGELLKESYLSLIHQNKL